MMTEQCDMCGSFGAKGYSKIDTDGLTVIIRKILCEKCAKKNLFIKRCFKSRHG